jgi:hypothetical protein
VRSVHSSTEIAGEKFNTEQFRHLGFFGTQIVVAGGQCAKQLRNMMAVDRKVFHLCRFKAVAVLTEG